MSTGNRNTSVRRRLGDNFVFFLEARRNKKTFKQCDRPSSKDEEYGVKDEGVDIMSGLGSASTKFADKSSDSDNREYEVNDKQEQKKAIQKEADITINKWRRLKSLNPQAMLLNDWLNT